MIFIVQDLKNYILNNFLPFFIFGLSLNIKLEGDNVLITSEEISKMVDKTLSFNINHEDNISTFTMYLVRNNRKDCTIFSCARKLLVDWEEKYKLNYNRKFTNKLRHNIFLTSEYFDQNIFDTGNKIPYDDEIFTII